MMVESAIEASSTHLHLTHLFKLLRPRYQQRIIFSDTRHLFSCKNLFFST